MLGVEVAFGEDRLAEKLGDFRSSQALEVGRDKFEVSGACIVKHLGFVLKFTTLFERRQRNDEVPIGIFRGS